MHPSVLTPRLARMVGLLAEGKSDKQISHAMGISLGSTKVYMSQILRILKFRNRVEVAAWVAEALQGPR